LGTKTVVWPAESAWAGAPSIWPWDFKCPSALGPQRYTPPPGLGLEKIGKWLFGGFGSTIWCCICKLLRAPGVVYIESVVFYSSLHIHHQCAHTSHFPIFSRPQPGPTRWWCISWGPNVSTHTQKQQTKIKTCKFLGVAFFERVFSPKGVQNNSPKWGVWGRGHYIYIYTYPVIHVYLKTPWGLSRQGVSVLLGSYCISCWFPVAIVMLPLRLQACSCNYQELIVSRPSKYCWTMGPMGPLGPVGPIGAQ